MELRLVMRGERAYGLSDGKIVVEGDDPDHVWSDLHETCGRSSPRYFGFDGARKKFHQSFPSGFQGAGYEGHEREYKLKAKRRLDEIAPLAAALEADGMGEAILSVYRATNLLSPFEQTRMQAVLRSAHADDFIKAAAQFATRPTKQALHDMERILKPHDNAKWTAVTYLPFLWRPKENMFLKPIVTVDFAERVGHPFAHVYRPRLDVHVYECLLDLAQKTESELSDLGPKDRIDIQSFIWVIGGSYDEEPARP